MSTYPQSRQDFLRALRRGGAVRLMEAHNGLSALIANNARDATSGAQFDGLWVSSLTCTASAGLPDLEMSIIDNRIENIRQIVRASAKPVIVDADTGGDVSSFRYFCRTLNEMGVAGVIVEEKAIPKRNSLDESNQALADPYEFADKLLAGKDFVQNPDFLVIARIESLVCGRGLDDALSRARIYRAAGVDGLMIHSKSASPAEVQAFGQALAAEAGRLPIFCVPTTYHTTPAPELFAAGIQGVIYANHQLRAAHSAMEQACLTILQDGCTSRLEKAIASTRRIFDDVGYTAEVLAVEARAEARLSGSAANARAHG